MSGHWFSRRTGWDLGQGAFAAAIVAAKNGGRELVDLTVSNPTVCGFDYDAEAVLGPLESKDAMVYDPDPRGMRVAREAVAAYYAEHDAPIDPYAVVLTTSTSEAYSYLFRLLCDAGDEVLVAQPSYPLFDFLADLDDVTLKAYPLFYDFGWWIDFAELERRIGPKTRAILVVHPNNPTGHWTHAAERERLEEVCERHGLALIVDEVFLDYAVNGQLAAMSFAAGPHRALTFVLSGISKVAALPQMKAAWVVTQGAEDAVREALTRMEIIADTFLSMNAPTQLALPAWLAGRGAIQEQICLRVAENLTVLQQAPFEVRQVEAGWSGILMIRAGEGDAAERLLEAGVVTHPGSFYGLEDRRLVVVSLIAPAQVFAEGVRRIVAAG